MSRAFSNPVSIAINKRDISVREYCKNNSLNYTSFTHCITGISTSRAIIKHLAINDPEIFNLLPENSRKILKQQYAGCNIPR